MGGNLVEAIRTKVTGRFGALSHLAFVRHVLCESVQLLPHDPPSQSRPRYYQYPGRLADGALFHFLHDISIAGGISGRSLWPQKSSYLGRNHIHHRQSYIQPGNLSRHSLPRAIGKRSGSVHGVDLIPETDRQLVSEVTAGDGHRIFRDVCHGRQQCRNKAFRIAWRSSGMAQFFHHPARIAGSGCIAFLDDGKKQSS